MTVPEVTPYGAWRSPLTARSLVQGAAGISEVMADPVRPWMLWWAESRPDNGGRTSVMCCDLRSGESQQITTPDANVRTLVHEYGGGAWWPHDGDLYYVEYTDQRLYRQSPGGEPSALTPASGPAISMRFADGRVTPDRLWCICVNERDVGIGEPQNRIVAVDMSEFGEVRTLWDESDFVMSPRVSPDGTKLAWISWDHPNMPWDDTRLHVCELLGGELGRELAVLRGDHSLCEPDWDPQSADRLLVCSDHEDWWGVYEVDLATAELIPVLTGSFDVATPPWVFGMRRWTFVEGEVVAAAGLGIGDKLIVNGEPAEVSDTSISSLTTVRLAEHGPSAVAYAGAGYHHETEVVTVSLSGDSTPQRQVVRAARDLGLDPELLGTPEAITFATGGDDSDEAHALYYRPVNPAHVAASGERPPLLVMAHGGPTAAARRQLQLGVLYWTSRGFAVVDVDYRGSTGYGRSYREALNGAWGKADVEDCVAAARYLVDRGDVDPARLAIRGGSAGGFTVLAALAFHDTFAAGASSYGVADLEALAADTHKFESRYLDRLVGPHPEAADVYRERSPINHVDRFDAPMIVLQGSEDEIVPPAQAEMIVSALESRGVPVAYLLFEGEQHGFRQADNIVTALESELAFYGRVLGFTPVDELPEVQIRNLP